MNLTNDESYGNRYVTKSCLVWGEKKSCSACSTLYVILLGVSAYQEVAKKDGCYVTKE